MISFPAFLAHCFVFLTLTVATLPTVNSAGEAIAARVRGAIDRRFPIER